MFVTIAKNMLLNKINELHKNIIIYLFYHIFIFVFVILNFYISIIIGMLL